MTPKVGKLHQLEFEDYPVTKYIVPGRGNHPSHVIILTILPLHACQHSFLNMMSNIYNSHR